MGDQKKRPNNRLKQEREVRGWSQEDLAEKVGTTQKIVSRWERGVSHPLPYYRQKLCQIFNKNAQELGFLDKAAHDDSQAANSPMGTQQALPVQFGAAQSADVFNTFAEQITSDQQAGLWLAVSTQNLTPLFDEGWTPHMILEALHVLLPGVHAMSQLSRRAFGQHILQLGATAFLSGIPLPTGKHVSAEEKTHLCQTLGESITAGWRLFHTTSNAQVLAIGQAQLSLLQHASSLLPTREQTLFYSTVYSLIGGALHFQGRYDDALAAHHKAYLAALEGMHVRNMAQNRMWQAFGLKAQRQYAEALQTIEAALKLTSIQNDLESIRTTAHLLASGAEIAALIGDEKEVQSKLSASEQWLEHLPGQHEEFDRAGWYEIAGVCSLHLKQYDLAVKQLKQAIEILPPQSVLRHITAFMPLVMAYANVGERGLSLSTAEQALPLLRAINALDMNRQFVQYTTCALSGAFPHDKSIQTFLIDIQHQLLPQHTLTIIE